MSKKNFVKKNLEKNSIKINKGAVISEPGSTRKYHTGDWRTFLPLLDSKKCIKCGKCWANCPDAAIFRNEKGEFKIDYTYCKGCLICEKECPVKAITHKLEEK